MTLDTHLTLLLPHKAYKVFDSVVSLHGMAHGLYILIGCAFCKFCELSYLQEVTVYHTQ